jgi:16S rRNA (cytosine1402-N4)-methyltransferase
MTSSALRAEPQLVLPGVVESVEWTWAEEETENMRFVHATVMKAEVLAALDPQSGVYIDATTGGGGHAEAILTAAPRARVIAFDRDPTALEAARTRLASFGDRVTFVHARFGSLEEQLSALKVKRIEGLCADLGVSSPQLDDPTRGISFRQEGPLDMRMDPSSGETALEMIERLTEEQLADVIFHSGDERRSRRIARSIKRALRDRELATTLDLRRAIVRAVGPVRVGGIDPATRTFQALRIALNDEVGELDRLLATLPRILPVGGIAAILSFHSLEDRPVKHTFANKAVWQPLTKKPQVPTDAECEINPRAASAKLRAARLVARKET